MVMDAERAPASAGVKVTEIVQLPPPARLFPQVLVWWKSDELVPVAPILVIVKSELHAFESVIV
jgi:hypothetical protein